MNLSQRLDQARASRNQGEADPTPTPFDLRMSRDAPVYTGTHLQTGEPMTPDRWEALRDQPDGDGLPTWNPSRANEHVTIDLRIDRPGPDDGVVIDLRDRRASHEGDPADEVFSMPAWAPGAQVFRAEDE